MRLRIHIEPLNPTMADERTLSLEEMREELREFPEDSEDFELLVHRVERYRNGESFRMWLLNGSLEYEAVVTVTEVSQ